MLLRCQIYSIKSSQTILKLLYTECVHNSSDFLKFGYKRKLSQFHKLNLGAKLRILCLSFCSIDSSFFLLFINKIPAKLPRYLINKKGQNTLTGNSTTLKSFRKKLNNFAEVVEREDTGYIVTLNYFLHHITFDFSTILFRTAFR